MHTRNVCRLWCWRWPRRAGARAVRPRWLGGGSLGAPVKISAERRADGRVRPRRGRAAAERHRHGGRRRSRRRCTPIPTRPCCACGWRRSTCAPASSRSAREQCRARGRGRARQPRRARAAGRASTRALGRDDDAIAIYERVLALDPDVPGGLPLPRRALRKARRGRSGDRDAAAAHRAQPELAARLLLPRARLRGDGAARPGRAVLPRGPQAEPAVGAGADRPRGSPTSCRVAGRRPIELYERILAQNPAERGGAASARRPSTPGRSVSTTRSRSSASSRRSTPIRARRAPRSVSSTSRRASSSAPTTEFNLVLASAPDNVRVRYYLGRGALRSSDRRSAPSTDSPASRRTRSTTSTRRCAARTCCRRTTPPRPSARLEAALEGAARQPRADGVPGVALSRGEAVPTRDRVARADRRAVRRTTIAIASRSARRTTRPTTRIARSSRCARRSS